MNKPFTIGRVSWSTQRKGDPLPFSRVALEYWVLSSFLQRNSLTLRQLAQSQADITDDFEIRSDDLTAEGLEFMRKGYQKWLRMLDRGGDPSDTRILERELAKQRGLK
jgi:hypothetical protein